MSSCEKCWGDAYLAMLTRGGTQADHYHRLIEERRDNPCTPEEQAGEWWDGERDRRIFDQGGAPKEGAGSSTKETKE